jgi:hypothetical protein
MTKPYTSISLGFHSQSEPTRSELHQDPHATFARFGITPATYKGFLQANQAAGSKDIKAQLATAEDMLKAAIAIEDSSRKIRETGGKNPDEPLRKLIDEFLRLAASWVAAEVALGITEPDQPVVNQPGQLIRRMYLLLYSSAFRQNPDRGDFNQPAWDTLLAAVKAGTGRFDDLLPHCRTLCGQVATEFTNSLWPPIW